MISPVTQCTFKRVGLGLTSTYAAAAPYRRSTGFSLYSVALALQGRSLGLGFLGLWKTWGGRFISPDASHVLPTIGTKLWFDDLRCAKSRNHEVKHNQATINLNQPVFSRARALRPSGSTRHSRAPNPPGNMYNRAASLNDEWTKYYSKWLDPGITLHKCITLDGIWWFSGGNGLYSFFFFLDWELWWHYVESCYPCAHVCTFLLKL